MTMTRDDILSVMRDGSRIDRWIARAADGELYLTTKDSSEFRVFIPLMCGGLTEEEEADEADAVMANAEEELAAWED